MPERSSFAIPLAVPLASPEGWESVDSEARRFGVVRSHFNVHKTQSDPGPFMGEVAQTFHGAEGIEETSRRTQKVSVTSLNVRETVENFVIGSTSMAKLLADIGGEAKAPGLGKVTARAGVELATQLKAEFSAAIKSSVTVGLGNEVTYEHTRKVSHTDGTVFLVPVYKRCRYSLWLSYVDLLDVTYKTSLLGLRRKRRKFPPPEISGKHKNEIPVKRLVAQFLAWELNGMATFSEDEYVHQVLDPMEITMEQPVARTTPLLVRTRTPNLYQVSNVAFPIRWLNLPRKGFTQEDLMAVEVEAAEAEQTAWFRLNVGPRGGGP